MLRNHLQKGGPRAFIIDSDQPRGGVELRKARCASQYQDIAASGVESNSDNDMQRGEDNLGESVDGTHLEER